MLGKRRRSEDDEVEAIALTEENLAALDSTNRKVAVHQRNSNLSTTISYRSAGSTSCSQTDPVPRMAQALKTYRIFLDRKKSPPPELAQLLKIIKTPREHLPTTPKSRKVAERWEYTKNRQEKDAIAALEQLFGYCPEGWDGEWGIDRGQDLPWKAGSVPVPDAKENKTLQQAMLQMGAPKTPIPDICYGYTAKLFNQEEMDAMSSLESTCFVTGCVEEPILPFLVMEWKAKKGSLEEAQQQVRRDGSAAVNSITNFFANAMGRSMVQQSVGTEVLNSSADADKTAVFSLCVDSNNIELRVHWRRLESDGTVTWEADLIEDGMLRHAEHVFKIRSCMLNILAWARGERLSSIKDALHQRILKLGVAPLPTPPASSLTRASSNPGSVRKRRRVGEAALSP